MTELLHQILLLACLGILAAKVMLPAVQMAPGAWYFGKTLVLPFRKFSEMALDAAPCNLLVATFEFVRSNLRICAWTLLLIEIHELLCQKFQAWAHGC